jgi:hypothetical protein
VGRPRLQPELENLVVRWARENSGWGYDRIVGALVNLEHPLSDQTVGNILRRHVAPATGLHFHYALSWLVHGRSPELHKSGRRRHICWDIPQLFLQSGVTFWQSNPGHVLVPCRLLLPTCSLVAGIEAGARLAPRFESSAELL